MILWKEREEISFNVLCHYKYNRIVVSYYKVILDNIEMKCICYFPSLDDLKDEETFESGKYNCFCNFGCQSSFYK